MTPPRDRFSLTARLSGLAAASPNKGDRTRLRLKAAAADLLGSNDYHEVQMLDISRAAGLSNGAVYQYFENKSEITVEVLSEFLKHAGEVFGAMAGGGDPYQDFHEAYLLYAKLYKQNAGLMRCLHRLGDTIPETGRLLEAAYSEWCGRLAHIILKGEAVSKADEERTILITRALAVMGNEFLYDLYLRRSPMLVKLDKTPGAVASMLATIFFRSVYGRDPAPLKARPVRARAGRTAETHRPLRSGRTPKPAVLRQTDVRRSRSLVKQGEMP